MINLKLFDRVATAVCGSSICPLSAGLELFLTRNRMPRFNSLRSFSLISPFFLLPPPPVPPPPPPIFQDRLRTATNEQVTAVLRGSAADLTRLISLQSSAFPHASLPSASAAFKAELLQGSGGANAGNATVDRASLAVRGELADVSAKIMTLERWIGLNTPVMEDGGNFGVGVQMVVAKFLKESREEIAKTMAALPAYYKERADAFEKLPHPLFSSQTTTRTSSSSQSTGGKDGPESKESTASSTEAKSSERRDEDRVSHVVAIDVAHYWALSAALQHCVDLYACVIDNVEKNKEKLSNPRSGAGGHSGMSM